MRFVCNKENMISNENNGYTLIEILITIAILGIITGVTITTYLSAYRSYVASQILNQLQEDGERIMKQIERSARASVSAQVFASGRELRLVLDADSLEYQQNGGCRNIRYVATAQTSSANGRFELSLSPSATCTSPGGLVGGGVLNSTDTRGGVSVEQVTFSVADNPATNTQTITVRFTLRQGVQSTTRNTYEIALPMQSVISTRQYVR